MTNTAGTAFAISAGSGSPQSATINLPFTSPLVAMVTDLYGNPVSGATVTFMVPSTGASASLSGSVTATTLANGRATSASLTANATAGTYSVTASVNGAGTPATFTLTNTASPSTTTLVAPANPIVLGTTAALTASVSPSLATGTVTFYDGSTVLGVAQLSGGSATFSTKALPAGLRSLKARYDGSVAYAASLSAPVAATVNTTPATTFNAAENFATGTAPRSVVVADLDGDGIAELAIANEFSNNVSVMFGNGDGTFKTEQKTFQVGASPYSITFGDFNGDGKIDLAVANAFSNNVSVLLGNGNAGTFTFLPAVTYPAGQNPESVAVGDFNGDGKADLVVADFGGGNVNILLGNQGIGRSSPPCPSRPEPVLCQSQCGTSTETGTPSWRSPTRQQQRERPARQRRRNVPERGQLRCRNKLESVVVGDFKGNGKAHLAVANSGSNNVSVLMGNGDGTFQAAVNYPAGTNPKALAVGDLNGDGKADLAVANFGDNNISALLGNGDGTFQAATNYGVGTNPQAVAVGDFNGRWQDGFGGRQLFQRQRERSAWNHL